MRTEPIFVKPNDFFNRTGIDLGSTLKANDNMSNAANIFLMEVEDELMARIDQMSFRVYSWDNLSEYQKECMQMAIIKEAEYLLRNGDIFTDSGYDPEKGVIISSEQLRNLEICRTSLDYLRNCGLLNQNIINRRRFTRLN